MNKGFIGLSTDFIIKYITPILLMVVIFFLMTSYMAIHNITFSRKRPVLKRVVIIENLDAKESLPERFCKVHLTDYKAGDAKCRALRTKDACLLTDCCVWATHAKQGQGCVAGKETGPIFNKQDYKGEFLFQQDSYSI